LTWTKTLREDYPGIVEWKADKFSITSVTNEFAKKEHMDRIVFNAWHGSTLLGSFNTLEQAQENLRLHHQYYVLGQVPTAWRGYGYRRGAKCKCKT
jgi:hypothetical protein